MANKNLFSMKSSLNFLLKNRHYTNRLKRCLSVWTKDKIVTSPLEPVNIPNVMIHEYVWQNLDKWPKNTATVCAVTGRSYTYEQMYKNANNFGANLRKKFHIRDGDVVAVMLPNVPEYPAVVLGVLAAGGIATTINPIYTSHEVHKQILMSEAKLIVTMPETVATIKEAQKLAKVNIPIIVIDANGGTVPNGTVLFKELSEDDHVDRSCLKEVKRSANDISVLPYSSGTTGLPKGVELIHRSIIANCQQMNNEIIACHNETTATHQDSMIAVLPFFHIYALSVLMFHKMSHGIKLVTVPKFQPEVFLQTLEKHKVNVAFVAPPLVLLMASHPAGSQKTFAHLDIIINGAAPLSETDAERLFTKMKRKVDFRQGYGLTETSPVATMSPKGTTNYNCVGVPLPNTELKIVDGNLEALGSNQNGELLIKGPQVMKGYKNNPQANADAFTDDGWFRTGDLVTVDENGVMMIIDRLKELIKVKGFQVPPAELEAILREHPSVSDAAVIGVPHPNNGEAPKAFVVLKTGTKNLDKEIKDFVNDKVAVYKRIDDLVFVDSIPKSSAGKILRKDLKAKFC